MIENNARRITDQMNPMFRQIQLNIGPIMAAIVPIVLVITTALITIWFDVNFMKRTYYTRAEVVTLQTALEKRVSALEFEARGLETLDTKIEKLTGLITEMNLRVIKLQEEVRIHMRDHGFKE